ncbi:MAG: hypothetical protein KA191_14300 [Verrucomicrobia bacterium]|jgi:hypothetical protein|nr:hypothetical protein [Verrucomicrobiota bacterium]OQC67602.1 MAG: hypothetical protein BWX48_00635 [Verrucomicrobia bacterium ADurb.Bin006]MDI9381454.1 hypothetical protein [Verrucomicrobiota bacterium]NMD21734.1 hypothetical protein [Verrucomicrobiota bacterium]HNU99512.1 hypothetical protein [Verrucomicrobiota bacterium]
MAMSWGALFHYDFTNANLLVLLDCDPHLRYVREDIYARCRPAIERRMGVPLSEGMAAEIMLLATGGGGFSSGRTLGLAVF